MAAEDAEWDSGQGLETVVGRSYGPTRVEVTRAGVHAYVRATSDDDLRWTDHAPPSYAGAILFAVAPQFLADPDVAPFATMVIHGEQTFEWYRPFAIGSTIEVTGSLEKIRERSGVSLASFSVQIGDGDGDLVTARSTFLMSGDAPPGGDVAERVEPAHDARGDVDVPVFVASPDDDLEPLSKSASRADLVRYAAASGDLNPIHWDHDLAVSAGLGGVVAHGLLAAAWSTQAATRLAPGSRPLARARIRFRSPMYPGSQARVVAAREASRVTATVQTGDVDHVAAQIELAAGGVADPDTATGG